MSIFTTLQNAPKIQLDRLNSILYRNPSTPFLLLWIYEGVNFIYCLFGTCHRCTTFGYQFRKYISAISILHYGDYFSPLLDASICGFHSFDANWKLPNVLRIIGIPVCSIALILICQIAGISEVNDARTIPQQTFSDVKTNSLLPGVDLGGGLLMIAQNIFQVFFGVVFPISIYNSISIYSFFAIYLCTFLSSIVLFTNWKINTGATLYKYHYFPVSFMIVQLIFEPDLGSYVRHIVPFIPILLMQIINRKSLDRISGMQNRKLHK